MKVLQVAPSLSRVYGGPVYSLVAFARAAQLAGIEATITGPEAPSPEIAWIRSELPDLKLYSFPTIGSDAFIFSAPMLSWLSRSLRSFDVIHVHGLLNPVSSLAAMLARIMHVPYVLHPFGTLSRYTFSHRRTLLKRGYFQAVDGPNLKHAGAVHFTTSTERDEAKWHKLGLGSRAHIVPPPWIGERISPIGRVVHAPGSEVLLMARLHPVKDVEVLLEAWPLVRSHMPGARLTIAGDGKPEYVRSLKAHADVVAPDSGVRFAGFVRAGEKRKLLAEADVFVLPSHHENFGVVVLEALAAGIPVILTREVQLCSFVEEHNLGRIVLRNPRDIAQCIVQTLTDSALRSRCSVAAPELVERHFAPITVGALLRTMYVDAIAHTRDAAAQPEMPEHERSCPPRE